MRKLTWTELGLNNSSAPSSSSCSPTMLRCVIPISHFGICYETNANTQIKMSKISRLCLGQLTTKMILNTWYLIRVFSFLLPLPIPYSCPLIRQNYRIEVTQEKLEIFDWFVTAWLLDPSCPQLSVRCLKWISLLVFCPKRLCSSSENEEFPHHPQLPQLHLHPPGFREGFGRRSTAT